jgi:hypothetical protein
MILGTLIGIGIIAVAVSLGWAIMVIIEFLYEFYRWRRQLEKIRTLYAYNFMCSEWVNWDEMIEDLKYANYLRESGFKETGFRIRHKGVK